MQIPDSKIFQLVFAYHCMIVKLLEKPWLLKKAWYSTEIVNKYRMQQHTHWVLRFSSRKQPYWSQWSICYKTKNIKNIMRCRDCRSGKHNRDDSIKLFSIQPYPIYLSLLKICRVGLHTELFHVIIPTLFSCFLLSLHLVTFLMFFSLVYVTSF